MGAVRLLPLGGVPRNVAQNKVRPAHRELSRSSRLAIPGLCSCVCAEDVNHHQTAVPGSVGLIKKKKSPVVPHFFGSKLAAELATARLRQLVIRSMCLFYQVL